MANFEVDSEQRPGEVVIRLSGELDLAAFDEVDEVLLVAQSDGNRTVRIDLRGLEFIDSSGIRLLLLGPTTRPEQRARALHHPRKRTHPADLRANRPRREAALLRRRDLIRRCRTPLA